LTTPVAVYKINLWKRDVQRLSIAPLSISTTESWGRLNDNLIHAKVDLSIHDEEAALFLRTLFRADPFLHPHLIPPAFDLYPQPAKMSPVQEDALQRLMRLDHSVASQPGNNTLVELGLVQPTGEGKTVVAAKYVDALKNELWSGRRPKLILTVEAPVSALRHPPCLQFVSD
jgi:hypothetical protein